MVKTAEQIYRSYYTKSDPIVRYMVDKLSIVRGLRVLEPCAGDGAFIDALNGKLAGLSIDVYELNPAAVEGLKDRYKGNSDVKIIQGDTLTDASLFWPANTGGCYDRIIGNPPYGGWLDYEKRKYLKVLYPGLYVKETYGLFLYRCTRLLRDAGILVFIVPDTFLNLHMHKALRGFLLTNTKVKEICLFPSSFFPGVNFGYSNLCILTLEKCCGDKALNNEIRVISGFKRVAELNRLVEGTGGQHHKIFTFKQEDVYNNIDHALFVSDDTNASHLINHSDATIGDVADCVTGFYSGNDKRYLRPISSELRNAAKYEVLDASLICDDYASKEDLISGIKGPKCFIPIVKGGGLKYLKPDRWYMDWSVQAVQHYKADSKARFQNSRYYFKFGIGVPMISSSQITAALIENRLFDQSIVGIFPKDDRFVYYFLALFNSPICNRLIRTINPSANNPANYIKKIPFMRPSEETLKEIDSIVDRILTALKKGNEYCRSDESALNAILEDIYGSPSKMGGIDIPNSRFANSPNNQGKLF